MQTRIETRVPTVLVILAMFGANIPDGYAKSGSSYGPAVDTACQSFNGTRPFTDQSCALCHDTSNLGKRVDPQWTQWRSGNLTALCPEAPNQAPNGIIDVPATDLTIDAGETATFNGSGSDPDGNTPLTFNWNFGGGAPNRAVEDPGSIRFDSAGIFRVTLRVTDNLGANDPTPGTRTITVNEPTVVDPPQVCTDSDGDGFAAEGNTCGPVDCDDANPSINPDAPEICTDGVDNNCNALTDVADPDALDCPVSDACMDNDGDGFSADGGLCGPIDCDDFAKAVNPGAAETCGDDLDNDCDGAIDMDDSECDGSDCIARHFGGGDDGDGGGDDGDDDVAIDVRIDEAKWNAEKRRLRVEGDKVPSGSVVTITNAGDGTVLGTAVVREDEEWRFDIRLPRDSVPCRVRAEIGDRFDEENVDDAPRSMCGNRDDDDDDDHDDEDSSTNNGRIEEAKWKAEKRTLLVKGKKAPSRAIVTIKNAATGEAMGTTTAKKDGEWLFEKRLRSSASAPCRVRAEIGDWFDEENVDEAPRSICGKRDDDKDDDEHDEDHDADKEDDEDDKSTGRVRIEETKWDGEKRRLSVKGKKAPSRAVVTITDPVNGQVLGTTTAKKDGEWLFKKNLNTGSVPCRVRAEIDGRIDEKKVNDAPRRLCGKRDDN